MLLLISLVGKNADLRRASLISFCLHRSGVYPDFLQQEELGRKARSKAKPGVSDVLIDTHEGAAILALFLMEITGAFALTALWQLQRPSGPARWTFPPFWLSR